MRRRWHMPGAYAALLAVVLAAGCDRAPDRTETPLSPETTTGDLLGLRWLRPPEPRPASNLTFIEERQPEGPTFASALIGLLGGTLGVTDHLINIPRGAVLQTTLFTMYAPSTRTVDVELNALGGNLLGGVLRLLTGFEKPVILELSYANATNVEDPSRLVIVRLLDNGGYEILPTEVDRQRKVVRARLDHFSKYAMASN